MKGTEVRELLGQLEEAPAPEPSPLFVAKLEADLRSMDQASEAKAPRARTHRARVLIAAAPVAALASETVSKTGCPSMVSPPLPGVTPPTRFVPAAFILRV